MKISNEKSAFIGPDAQVYGGEARVFGKARVYGGKARVFGKAQVYGGKARVFGKAQVFGDARVDLNKPLDFG